MTDFEFDDAKSMANFDKHGIDFKAAKNILFSLRPGLRADIVLSC